MDNEQLVEFYKRANDTAFDYPRNISLHGLIADRCREFADKTAVFYEDQEMSYEQLDSAANRLANFLVEKGVCEGDLIGVCCDRNIDMPVLLNGILRSGAGYVALDPDYPLERLQYMAENAELKYIVAHESQRQLVESFQTPVVYCDSQHTEIQSQPDTDPNIKVDVDNGVAYVIFTSGSTGKPKGVLVPHRAAVNLMFAFQQKPGFTSEDRILATTTLSFDLSVVEMFLPLSAGGQMAIIDRKTAKDQQLLVDAIQRYKITFMQATASLWRIICEVDFHGGPRMKFITGGEPLPRDLIDPMLQRCGQLWNCYGPTETTVWSSGYLMTRADERILVGTPLVNTTAYIVDENGQLCPPETEGEVWIGGDCVTLGYIKRDELTAQKYVELNGERVYRSGDLGMITESGDVEIVGRIDNQVKIRGHRIELGEIDAAMAAADSNIRLAAAVVREDQPGDIRLVGYVLPQEGRAVDLFKLKTELEKSLPEYMIPAAFSVVDEFPYTPSGKTDRKAFPPPSTQRPDIGVDYVAPMLDNEIQLAEIWKDVLQLDQVGVDDNFFELGGNSIKALKVVKHGNAAIGTRLTNAEFFDNPTIRAFISSTINAPVRSTQQTRNRRDSGSGEFAVIGLAAKLPGAKNVHEYWQNLIEEKETTRFFNEDELDTTLPKELVEDPNYVKARGIIDGADEIDAKFFNMPPREAELVDPQQRVMLEIAWTALEDAGCIPGKFDGKIGVWAGTYSTTYFTKNILPNPDIVEQTGEFQLGTYNEKDYIATRVAHRLNLNGPAVNVNTACSTSLVAIINACNSLRAGFCDAAIAGGVSIHFPQKSGHLHQEGSIFSPDGRCRPFDADSAGTLFSDGAGAVVLKRLEDAIEDNDQIYAIVKGFGINNDGGNKASFSAPSIEGQAEAIAMAHADAEIDADTIGYVEAHGTATPIGDPIEVAALTRAFNATSGKKQYCGIGSVKSNFGHTVAAAGVTGFIKAALSLKNETIPATLHYKKPNAQIDFESTPFFVCEKQTAWPLTDTPRRAGVSSFGVGGTNAHIVLQESPLRQDHTSQTKLDSQLLTLSAKNQKSLEVARKNLSTCLTHSPHNLVDVAETLNCGRQDFNHRGFCVADSVELAIAKLNSGRSPDYVSQKASSNRNVVFLFPGQGAQYVRMGQDLYQRIPTFKNTLDTCFDILEPLLGQDLRQVLFPEKRAEESSNAALKETRFTQPILFSVGYSLAQTMMSFGVFPSALIGHSIGEFVAACIAEVFSLEDGLKFIAKRGELMQNLPSGAMISVRLPGSQVEPFIKGQMSIASYNGPELCVVAGPRDQVETLKQQLESDNVICKHLHTSHAFHSPMMDSVVDPFARFITTAELDSPQIPIVSTVTGSWMRDEEATDPGYWAEHLRQPVRFSDAISQLWNDDPSLILIELGPRKTLSTLALQHASERKTQIAVPTMSDTVENQSEWKSFLSAVGQLWSIGIDIDLSKLSSVGQKISLPTYPFERKQFFVQPPNTTASPSQTVVSESQSNHQPVTAEQTVETGTLNNGTTVMNRIPKIIESIHKVFENSSGFDLSEFEDETTFFEMGLDSLVLTQTATALKRNFDVDVTFRQLLEDTPNVISLAEFLDGQLPADRFTVEPVVASATENSDASQPEKILVSSNGPVQQASVVNQAMDVQPQTPIAHNFTPPQLVTADGAQAIINNQLQLMAAQLQLLGGNVQAAQDANAAKPLVGHEPRASVLQQSASQLQPADQKPGVAVKAESNADKPNKKAFGAAARVNLNNDELTDVQKAKLDEVIRETENMMPSSKAYAQQHRKYMADPRTVSGFRPNMKEMTFPIVVEKSKGVYMYDLDGNEFIDYTCGFGSNFLGHSTELIVDAVKAQAPIDYSIGPQSPLAGEVAKMFCDVTGNERMAYSNTGSEAVLGCTRLARTYTGKQKIAMFTGDYHGILDEVIVRGNKSFKSFPAATGIPREHVDNTLVLDYGTPESLELIRENLDDLAAIVVETVQSRRPELQPKEFLHELRALTEDIDTALIFDEVITGFRIAPGGAQQHFGIRADLASYGKVVGGGMPIGLIGGRAKYMDGLDGGFWQYGDDSRPEAGMTYFAGTFVRHPITLAASKAILGFIQREGQALYDRLNALSDDMAHQLNAVFKELDAPIYLANFGSMFKVQFEQELPYSELIFAKLRLKGFFIWDHRPCLLNVQHTQAHVDAFVQAFREVIIELQQAGFVPGDGYKKQVAFNPNKPPCAEAKVGKDRRGNPGWFVADAENPGQFVQVSQTV